MQAIVGKIVSGWLCVGIIRIHGRRNCRDEIVAAQSLRRAGTDATAFAVGDRIEVNRVANDPYLQFVRLLR